MIFVGSKSKRAGGGKRRKGGPRAVQAPGCSQTGGCTPCSPPRALASILFYPFSPFFNLWGSGYLLGVPCSAECPQGGQSLGAARGPQRRRWQSLEAPCQQRDRPGPVPPPPRDTHPEAGVPQARTGSAVTAEPEPVGPAVIPPPGAGPHQTSSRSGTETLPGWVKRAWEKELSTRNPGWVLPPPHAWCVPPAAFPLHFTSRETLFTAKQKKAIKVTVQGVKRCPGAPEIEEAGCSYTSKSAESQAQLLRDTLRAQTSVLTKATSCSGFPEQVIAFSVMSACFLLPTAWILAHVEHYKSRSD
ncbi:uncharacterized protein LOC142361843 [Opisthocomus hoazin]|uniref:uncharacterized protein LOC142361843 n=1 Tax=Opisthocomus hoazin TaxID=30419 RepID=UPI003F5382FF